VIWGNQYHGAALASVALFASERFREVLIPATHSLRDLVPWGSHPELDPLWSTEAVALVHDGPISRLEKLRKVAHSDVAMRHLRVCFRHSLHGMSALNCGRCEKCLRTMAGLRAIGALQRCQTLPREVPLRTLARTAIPRKSTLAYTRDNLEAARAAGDDELATALRQMAKYGVWRSRWARFIATTTRRVRRRAKRSRRRARRLRRRLWRRGQPRC
jgi:hypothetical protein